MNKITKVEVQKRNKNRVNVFVDDEFLFACDMELVYKYSLNKDSMINVDKIREVLQEEEYISCKNYILRVLERTYKTEKEVIQKLTERKYSEDTIRRTVDFLKNYKFIDDVKYAQMFVKDKSKSQGKNNIRYKLRQKGISDENIDYALSNIDEDEEFNTALALCTKKYNIISKSESDKNKIRQKLFRFLVSKGYNFNLANKVISSVLNIDIWE